MIIKSYTKPYSLSEAPQTNKIKFALCTQEKDTGEFTQVMPLVKCREYFTDILCQNHQEGPYKDVTVYGFESPDYNIKEDGWLLVDWSVGSPPDMDGIEQILKQINREIKVIHVISNTSILVSLDKFWWSSIFHITFFTYLFRGPLDASFTNGKDTFDIYDLCDFIGEAKTDTIFNYSVGNYSSQKAIHGGEGFINSTRTISTKAYYTAQFLSFLEKKKNNAMSQLQLNPI